MKQVRYEINKATEEVFVYVEGKYYTAFLIDDAIQFYIEDLRSWTEDFEKEV